MAYVPLSVCAHSFLPLLYPYSNALSACISNQYCFNMERDMVDRDTCVSEQTTENSNEKRKHEDVEMSTKKQSLELPTDSQESATDDLDAIILDLSYAAPFVTLALGLGSKLGIFELLAKLDGPKTCGEIAKIGNFKERYVREWLGCMVCSKIVEITDDGNRFWLPEHRHSVLCDLQEGNLAALCGGLAQLAQVFSDVSECFYKNGPEGVPYSKYVGFHEWREMRMACCYNWKFLNGSFKMVPGLMEKIEKGNMEVLEMGCSSGRTAIDFAKNVPNCPIVGLDISEEAIAVAKKQAALEGATNLKFIVQDACNFPLEWTNKWEFIYALDVIHDIPASSKAISELYRVLQPGGQVIVMDINLHSNVRENINNPIASMYYTFSLFHCLPVSLFTEGSEGLGNSWGKERATNMFEDAGFTVTILEEKGSKLLYLLSKEK